MSEANLAELPGWALELLRAAPVAHLGLLDDPSERPEAIAALRAKYEPYRHRLPDGPLLELTPVRALHWRAV